jgi:hypothetical protein
MPTQRNYRLERNRDYRKSYKQPKVPPLRRHGTVPKFIEMTLAGERFGAPGDINLIGTPGQVAERMHDDPCQLICLRQRDAALSVC